MRDTCPFPMDKYPRGGIDRSPVWYLFIPWSSNPQAKFYFTTQYPIYCFHPV